MGDMTNSVQQRRWLVLLPVAVVGIIGVVLASLGGASATAQDGLDPTDVANHDKFTGPGDQDDWPPRPVGASGDLESVAMSDSAGVTSDTPAAVLADRADVAAELGDDYFWLSSVPGELAKDGWVPGEHTWFSRTHNHTVVAFGDEAGDWTVSAFPLDQLQPVISRAEGVEASDLGRQWFAREGLRSRRRPGGLLDPSPRPRRLLSGPHGLRDLRNRWFRRPDLQHSR